ncbi:GL11843, partial [Drosophila persimilis]
SCRLAFWGHIAWQTQDTNYAQDVLPKLRVFKRKQKVASIQRVVNANEVIVQNLFKKGPTGTCTWQVDRHVHLREGRIERTFGQTSQVCTEFREALSDSTIEKFRDLQVLLNCKKYVFNKQAGLFQ